MTEVTLYIFTQNSVYLQILYIFTDLWYNK
nr:MAG TPA: hypothetical protein [Caudoviricetes sp.]